MAKSSRVRVADVRAALRVVGECRDLAHDPAEWRRHAAEGLNRLTGSRMTVAGEIHWRRPDGAVHVLDFLQSGLTDAGQLRAFADFFRSAQPGDDMLFGPLAADPNPRVVKSRTQGFSDDVWYRSRMYTEYHQAIDLDHCAGSIVSLPGDRFDLLALHREGGGRDFSRRELELTRLFHAELGELIGPVLVSSDDSFSPTRLPPRVRETLRCLLEGDSEKQAAARMGLSRPTVHQYVTALYRHYRVTSRAELLVRVLCYRPEPPADGSPVT